MKTKESYRWVICGAATLMIFCAAGMGVSAFAYQLPYMRAVNGFSSAQASMLFTIHSISSIALILAVDHFYKRISLRNGITLSLLLLSVGFLLCGLSSNYTVFCIAVILNGIAYTLSGTTVAVYLINTWFSDDRAFAIGIATAGTGLAAVIAPLVIAPIIEKASLSTAFLVEAAFIFLCALLLFVVIRKGPYSMSGSKTPAAAKSGSSVRSGSKQSLFIFSGARVVLFMGGLFLCGFVILGVSSSLSELLSESFSGTEHARLVSVYGFAIMGGKLLCGRLSSRLGAYRTNYIFYSFLGVGLVLVCMAKSFALGLVAALFLGLGSPFGTVSLPAYTSDFAKEETFPTALKYGNLIMILGKMTFTTIAGAIADLFGSYVPLFAAMVIITLVSAVLIQNTYLKYGLMHKRG